MFPLPFHLPFRRFKSKARRSLTVRQACQGDNNTVQE